MRPIVFTRGKKGGEVKVAVGTIQAKFSNQVWFSVTSEGITASAIVDSETPGFEFLTELEPGDRVAVEVKEIGPRFSKRVSERAGLEITKIRPPTREHQVWAILDHKN